MDDLLAEAHARGLRVAWRDLGRRAGEFHSSGLILLNPRRTETVQRVTLAHELGHAHYGHTWTDDIRQHAAHERLADRFAARRLISLARYAAAERLVGPHPGAIARELEVTTRVVEAWRADVLCHGIPTQRSAS